MSDVPTWSVIRTRFPGPANWYARVTYPDGRTFHMGPWNTHWAADRCAILARRAWALAKRSQSGNGDTCPLFSEHGAMWVLNPDKGPPMQWCPNVAHDGGGPALPDGSRPPRTRAFWPLHGFEESVAAYIARFDRAVREASKMELPDLSTLEV